MDISWERLLKMKAGTADEYRFRAYVQMKVGSSNHLEMAISDLELSKQLSAEPTVKEGVSFDQMLCLYHLGELDRAVALCDQIQLVSPVNTDILRIKAMLLQEASRADEADAVCKLAAELGEKRPYQHDLTVKTFLLKIRGEVYQRTGGTTKNV